MTTALERAARALLDEMPSFVGEPYPHQSEFGASYIDCQEVDFLDLARAVLMAVREPDDDMKESAGWSEYDAGCWAEGVDAILGQNK